MKTYEITLFILGCNPNPATNEKCYIEAESEDEAIKLASEQYNPKGYGVLSSREYREELSDYQKAEARKYALSLLSNIISDAHDREAVMTAIEEDFYSDIEQTSAWLDLEEDEWCPGDVEIALARIIYERIVG